MLRVVYFGCLSPEWAENILLMKTPGSYITRQSDRDPEELLLSYVSPRGIKHVIVPEFEESLYLSKVKRFEKKLNDESVEVEKFLNSFDCKDPVTSEWEAEPPSFKKKSQPEDAAKHRCSVCTYESEDLKKARQHRSLHRAGLCLKCDRYFHQNNLTYHSKQCKDVKLLKCDHADKCDY